MKKLLIILGLFVAVFSFQVNAATLSLKNITSGHVDIGNNLVADSFHAAKTFSTVWRLTSSKDVTTDVMLTANPAFIFSTDVYVNHVKILSFAKDKLDKVFSLAFLSTDIVDFVVNGKAGRSGSVDISVSSVPVPAAVWLFGSALMGLMGFSRRKIAQA